ncbi:MAG: zinc-ribbon domain-containing protein [Clostridia bacterium]|nr:zinc-ribbon domain-containing protein [Clostridia bacterium]
MAFCRNCGTRLEDSAAFCPNCGAKVETEKKNNENFDFQEKINEITDTPDSTSEFAPEDIEANKITSLFAYLGILFIVPLLAAKDSPYARFHTNQGLILFIVNAALIAVTSFLSGICNYFAIIASVKSLVRLVISLVIFALIVFGVYNAVSGKAKELPVIGKFRIIK